MTRFRFAIAPLALGLLVSACSTEHVVAPGAVLSAASTASVTSDATPQGTVDAVAPYAVYFAPGKGNAVLAQAAAAGATVNFLNDRFGFAMITGLDASSASSLRAVSGVDEVALDELVDIGVDANPTAVSSDEVIASPEAPNTAAFYARQWHMRAIGAQHAWAAGKLGSASVTVAVIDGGIGYTVPDLAGRVDLARSASFLPIETSFIASIFPTAHPIADLQYHGTHVAATIASNGIVGAGVTSRTTLIGAKVCYGVTLANSAGQIVTRAGSCSGTAILAGIAHAIDNGANVVNMSLGGAFTKRGSKGYHSSINRLFNAAKNSGVVMVVAAGNDGSDLDRHELPDANGNPVRYPSLFKTYCDAPHVICVSATGPTAGATNGPWTDVDALAGYSNYGRSAITVAAPGGNAQPVWAACSRFSLAIPQCRTGNFIVGISGTSMASPHVAGLAALIAADGVTSPSQIRSLLIRGADDLGQPGKDPAYGHGRINVAGTIGM